MVDMGAAELLESVFERGTLDLVDTEVVCGGAGDSARSKDCEFEIVGKARGEEGRLLLAL